MKNICLLTSNKLSGYTTDDHLLEKELLSQGHKVKYKDWETLEDEGEDYFLIRTTWNYTENVSLFLEKLKTIQDRLWNPLPLVEWNSNKKYLIDLQEKGVPVIPLKNISDRSSLLAGMEELGGEEFIIKPFVGASAKGLIRFKKDELPDISGEMILQKFLPQITQGEVSLFFINKQLVYAVTKVPKEGDIRVQEEHGGSIQLHIPTDEEVDIGIQTISSIPFPWLYARVDIVPGAGLIELECIEPSFYFSKYNKSAGLLAEALLAH